MTREKEMDAWKNNREWDLQKPEQWRRAKKQRKNEENEVKNELIQNHPVTFSNRQQNEAKGTKVPSDFPFPAVDVHR